MAIVIEYAAGGELFEWIYVQVVVDARLIPSRAAQYALEFIEAVTDSPGPREAGVHRWIPHPNPEVVKVNVASFGFKAQQKVGLGVVVRNFKGEFMAASSC